MCTCSIKTDQKFDFLPFQAAFDPSPRVSPGGYLFEPGSRQEDLKQEDSQTQANRRKAVFPGDV